MIDLNSILNNSGLQKENQSLYQVILNLIQRVTDLFDSKLNIADLDTEGSWTARDVSGAGLTITSTASEWEKVGKQCTATINVSYPVTVSGANAQFAGLPFPTNRLRGATYSATIGFQNATLAMTAFILNGTDIIAFYLNTGVAVTNVQLSGKTIALTVTYRTI